MAYLLALSSAALYGAADFLGGLASRRASAIAIVIVSQAAGLLPLAPLLFLMPAAPTAQDFIWGMAAGVAGSAGVGLLYRALAIGTMSIVAPTTAVCAVLIPAAADVIAGQQLPPVTIVGMMVAIAAIVLVSQADAAGGRGRRGLPPGIGLALLSGVAIGFFFLALARTSAAAGLWPLLASRGLSIALFTAVALATSRPIGMTRPVLRVAIACGMVDMLANALYLLASRGGPLSVVVTLASLYPASTVVLARLVMGERLSRRQNVGIACALVAVLFIVSSTP
ncbi:MAG: DMT family transporter [Acidobacteria bacterium]|nr:DMT family transporter [Acidobacteriota bacterium]